MQTLSLLQILSFNNVGCFRKLEAVYLIKTGLYHSKLNYAHNFIPNVSVSFGHANVDDCMLFFFNWIVIC